MSTTNKTKTRRKARSVTLAKDEADHPQIDAQNAPVAPKEAKKRTPKEELVVFAFRLTPAERDQIHRAAGAAKASKFVRALTTAASRRDAETVAALMATVKTDS